MQDAQASRRPKIIPDVQDLWRPGDTEGSTSMRQIGQTTSRVGGSCPDQQGKGLGNPLEKACCRKVILL